MSGAGVTLNLTLNAVRLWLEVIDNRRYSDIIASGTWGVNVMRFVARALSLRQF